MVGSPQRPLSVSRPHPAAVLGRAHCRSKAGSRSRTTALLPPVQGQAAGGVDPYHCSINDPISGVVFTKHTDTCMVRESWKLLSRVIMGAFILALQLYHQSQLPCHEMASGQGIRLPHALFPFEINVILEDPKFGQRQASEYQSPSPCERASCKISSTLFPMKM